MSLRDDLEPGTGRTLTPREAVAKWLDRERGAAGCDGATSMMGIRIVVDPAMAADRVEMRGPGGRVVAAVDVGEADRLGEAADAASEVADG